MDEKELYARYFERATALASLADKINEQICEANTTIVDGQIALMLVLAESIGEDAAHYRTPIDPYVDIIAEMIKMIAKRSAMSHESQNNN